MYCTFCAIIAHDEPAVIRYEDDEVIVIENILQWVPVMLLVVPKKHMTQEELWLNIGTTARVAVEMGKKHCPNGFRLLSNFGLDALQTQVHGHLHVIGGTRLGLYVTERSFGSYR